MGNFITGFLSSIFAPELDCKPVLGGFDGQDIEHPPFYGAGLAPDITLKPASGSATISSMKAEAIRREALSLTARERAELAEQLLASLDTLSEDEVAQLWLHEAARRAEELDRGLSKRISADDVRREAQALLR